MKMPNEKELNLRLRPRLTESVTINIPADTLATVRKIAVEREMSIEALLKFYIGQGLRQDLAKAFSERVLARTAEVLTRHLDSPDEVSEILQEIRLESMG